MSQHIGTITIPSGQSNSDVMDSDDFGRCESICIMVQESALTGVCTVEVGSTKEGDNFSTLQSPSGTDVAIAADKAIQILAPGFPSFRIHSAGTEAEDRTFIVWGKVRG